MAKITADPRVDVRITFVVDEAEARALDALAGYGDDAFIKVFYDHLGKAYMRDHEAGLRKFLSSIRDVVNPSLASLDRARKVFDEA